MMSLMATESLTELPSATCSSLQRGISELKAKKLSKLKATQLSQTGGTWVPKTKAQFHSILLKYVKVDRFQGNSYGDGLRKVRVVFFGVLPSTALL